MVKQAGRHALEGRRINNGQFGSQTNFFSRQIQAKKANPRKKRFKSIVQFQNVAAKSCKIRKIYPWEVHKFLYSCIMCENYCYNFLGELKVITISARNTIIGRKFAHFVRLYFNFHRLQLHFSTKFWNLLLLKSSFQEFRFFWIDNKLVYNANCPILPTKDKMDNMK